MSFVIVRNYPNASNKFDKELGHCLCYKTLRIAKKELKENYVKNGQWNIYQLKELELNKK